jgi:rhodanese-related sulfurtransferase
MIRNISVTELDQWMKADSAVIVDVREPNEYQDGHIPGVPLIPVGQISLYQLPDFKGRKLVMQCRSGGRSQTACTKLLTEDPSLDIYNLAGGILAWEKAGLPITKD